MREIGGYFEIEKNTGSEYHNNCLCFNSARNCLRYLIKVQNIKHIFLPNLHCSAISNVCKEEAIAISYYSINKDFFPSLTIDIPDDAYLYIINYYGHYSEEYIKEIKLKHNNLILDNVHSFFSKPIENIDTIYSCRKYFGVPDGAYLYTNAPTLSDIPIDMSNKRYEHLMGRLEATASQYYDAYQRNEELIDKLPLMYMSESTHNLLRGIDYNNVISKRNANFDCLKNTLSKYNDLTTATCNGPFMYPLLRKDGYDIRKKLIEQKIYIPIFWPNVIDNMPEDSTEYYLSNNVVPLPCDQRYSIEEMKYISEIIIKIIKER